MSEDEPIPESELSELHRELLDVMRNTPMGSHPLGGLTFSSEGYPLFRVANRIYFLTNKHPQMEDCSFCQAGICVQRASPGDPLVIHFHRHSLS